MIKFINETLFSTTTEAKKNDHGEFFKTSVLTAMNVKRGKNAEMTKQMITSIISETEDYNSKNTSAQTIHLKDGKEVMSLRSSDRNKYDSSIYVVAIPFNGVAKPIEDSKQFRIYKGTIVYSDRRNIALGDDTFKKVLYLVIEPNTMLFDEDHKYHTDEISFNVESYNLETKQNGTDPITVKTVVTVTFTKDDVTYTSESEEVDPINTEDFKGKSLFPLFKKNNNGARKNTKYAESNTKSYKKGGYTNQEPDSHESSDSFERLMNKYGKDSKETQDAYTRRNNKKNRRR